MKTIRFLFFLSLITFSCNTTTKDSYSKEVIFFTQTDDVEILSDYEFHINNLFELYEGKEIKLSRIDNRNYVNGKINVQIDPEQTFAMILVDDKENHKIYNNFGTDVDMMLMINAFFKIQ